MFKIIKPFSPCAKQIQSTTCAPFFPFTDLEMLRRFGQGTETFGAYDDNQLRAYCHMATMPTIPQHINQVLENNVATINASHGIMYTIKTMDETHKNKGYASLLSKHIGIQAKKYDLKSLSTMSPYDFGSYSNWLINTGNSRSKLSLNEYLHSGDRIYRFHTSNGATVDDILNINGDFMIRYRYF